MPRKDGPPQRISDERLAKLPGHKIDEALDRRLRYYDTVAASDPGAGLPPVKAEPARAAQIETLRRETAELERLKAASDAWHAAPERRPGFLEMMRSLNRNAINEAHQNPEDKELIRQNHEALLAQEREREDKEKLRQLKEKREAGPPDPRAALVTAAVLSDSQILEGMRYRLRPAQGGGQRAYRTLDYEDVGVLACILHLLEESGSVLVRDFSVSAVFADPELPRISNLGPTLKVLRKNGWLDATFENGMGRYTYGPRTREIAARWQIDLPALAETKEPVPANA